MYPHIEIGPVTLQTVGLMFALAFLDAIVRAKPSGAKGKYVKKIAISSTMGPGVRLDTAEVAGA